MKRACLIVVALAAAALVPVQARAQEPARITGRVLSEAGAPLGSASVFVASLNTGTVSRPDGTFLLIVPVGQFQAGQSLQVTAQVVGHRSQTQTVAVSAGQTAAVNFQLALDVLELEGVVAVGLGLTTTRERLGVSISSVHGEDLTRVQTQNVVNAMAAKAPGIEITSSAGDPGASAYIRIRGLKTIQGSGQPLFVVDGVPITNFEAIMPSSMHYGEDSDLASTISTNRAADINPNDIESIEILKGAAASAIYGARAANGVVLITTKRGRAGSTRATLRTTFTTDEVNRAVPLQRSFGHGTNSTSDGRGLRSWGGQIQGQSYDHWGSLFERGRVIDSDLTVSGGNERTTYFLSLGRTDHNGVIVGDNDFFDRTSIRLKADHEVTTGLKLSGNFSFANVEGSYIQKGSNLSGLLLGGLRTPPDYNNCIPGTCYRDEEGFHRSYSPVFDNPFFTIHENRATSQVGRTIGSVSADYAPMRWLRMNYTFGLDYANDNRMDIYPIGNLTYEPGYMANAQFLNQTYTHNLTGTVTHSLREGIGTQLTLGASREARRYDRFFVEGQDFVAPGVYTLNNTVTRTPNEYRERIHTESYFAQVQLDLLDQLFLTAAVRNDGFSTFGQSEPRHLFPKASAAWEVSETLGLRGSILSSAKLRTAWGQAGNEPQAYGTLFGFSADDVGSGWNDFLRTTLGGYGGLYNSPTKPQPDLKPERTREWETGADVAFLQDRIGLGITFYDSRTEDAILLTPLSPSTGFFQQLQNAATIENKGVEVSLDVRAITTPSFGWTIGGNWSRNRNKVLDLGDPDREYVDMGGFIGTAAQVGHAIGVMRSNDFYRCGRLGEGAPAEIVTACQGNAAGALYINANGFPVLDPEIRVIGDPNPDWTAGIRSALNLGRSIQIAGLLDIKQGGDIWNGTKGALYSYGTHKDTERRATCTAPQGNRATGCTGNLMSFGRDILPGPVAGPGAGMEVPIGQNWYQAGLGSGFSGADGQFIEDGSFVKLREIALTYSLPTQLVQRAGMSGVDLRLAGRNLKTWTDYSGIDPETNLTGSSRIRGQDYFNNPQTRQWIVTVGLTR
jgi:TonB-linked SusC/RagA family outer membrane protein